MSASIWPPNWSQFLPDLAVALFTSLLIGLLLAWLQRRSHFLRTQRGYREQLSRIRPQIAGQLATSVRPNIDKWDCYATFAPLLDVLKDVPLSEWARSLNDPSLTALERFETNLVRFRLLCTGLDSPTERAVIATRPTTLPATQRAQRYAEAITAVRAIVLSQDFADQRMGFEDGELPEAELLRWAQSALEDRALATGAQQFNELRMQLDHDRETLSSAFAAAS